MLCEVLDEETQKTTESVKTLKGSRLHKEWELLNKRLDLDLLSSRVTQSVNLFQLVLCLKNNKETQRNG